MSRGWWGRMVFLVISTALAFIYIIPTVANLDPKTSKFPVKDKINLGLDLQGGLYLVMGVDFNKVYRSFLDRQLTGFKAQLDKQNLGVKSAELITQGVAADDPRIKIEYTGNNRDAIYAELRKEVGDSASNSSILRLTNESTGMIEFGLSSEHRNTVRDRTIQQSIEVIRNRIDQFGVSEPTIISQGTDRIVVELPGVKEIDRAKELIGRTAKLEFKIVDDKAMNPDQVNKIVEDIKAEHKLQYNEGDKFSDYVDKINEFAKGKIPDDDMIAFERVQGPTGKVLGYQPFLLKKTSDVTGDFLTDARVTQSQQTFSPEVAFRFNPAGAARFSDLTGKHLKERLAIVLDNVVHSAPVIQAQISESGVIQMGRSTGDKSFKEAQDLALVLRAGALPAQLELLEQRVVGAQLGEDSIQKGVMAGIIGAVLVFFFTIFYYRVSGFIAVISLIVNVIFVLAILVGMDATLTLPGIAGIALTIGIAVDSNVVIYERIREELRAGKSLIGSVEAGFQKAFRTIMDANVTNAGAAFILMYFGTGPIRGFAVTLLIGIITTLFTAVFFCKLCFDAYLVWLQKRRAITLSI